MFYIVGVADFQDMMPAIMECGHRGIKFRVCIFDCLAKKRQLYYYDPHELVNFVKDALQKNDISKTDVRFYGQKDQASFESDFSLFDPSHVFIQNARHRFPMWYPTAGAAKVIHFAWHMDSAVAISRGNYNVHLNVLKREMDEIYYGKNIPSWLNLDRKDKEKVQSVKSMYFGNFRVEHLKYKPLFKTVNLNDLKGKKVCFVSEAHLKQGKDNYKEVIAFVEEFLHFMHENGYYVVWKKREKGYPKEKWASPLDFCSKKPDMIIDKDLNFPSAISYIPSIAQTCFVINTSSAYWDIKKINPNTAMLQTKNPGPREEKYINLVYSKGDPNASFDLLNMQNENKFQVLSRWLDREKMINEGYIKDQSPSKLLFEFLEQESK
mgnify:FL=1